MSTAGSVTTVKPALVAPTRLRLFISATRYLLGKALTILATIFVGVFITLLIVNYPAGPALGISPFEQNLEGQIYTTVQIAVYQNIFPVDKDGPIQSEVDKFTQQLRSEAGLDLPFLPR